MSNLDADIIHVDVFVFEKEQFVTQYVESLHDHGLSVSDNVLRLRDELRAKLERVYPYATKIVFDTRIGEPMISLATR